MGPRLDKPLGKVGMFRAEERDAYVSRVNAEDAGVKGMVRSASACGDEPLFKELFVCVGFRGVVWKGLYPV